MLKKEYRLQKKYQFNYVYRVGRSLSGKFCVIYYCPSKNKNVKIGISVSHKLGGAIIRNKIKRRIREAVKTYLANLKQNFNIVIVAKTAIITAEYAQIVQEIGQILSKTSLLKDAQ